MGEVTAHHFLTDIAAKTIKPDRVIMRVFNRLHLVKDTTSFKEAREICNDIVKETGLSHRFIDIVIVKFGHLEDDMDTGIVNGICLEKYPKCSKCLLKGHCFYNKEESDTMITEFEDLETLKPIPKNNNYKNSSIKPSTILSKDSFVESDLFLKQGTNVQNLLKYLMLGMDSKNIRYNIKIRKDAIAFTAPSGSNIITIWLYKDHFRLLILNVEDRMCSSVKDIDSLLDKIHSKYIFVQ